MSEVLPQRSSNKRNDTTGTYTDHVKNADDISMSSKAKTDYENLSATEVITDQREKIQKLQLKSANYSQKQNKLKRDRDYLRKQINKLTMTVGKLEEHREQDAEALLAQEQKLAQLKGKYRSYDNPSETAKVKKSIQKITKEENAILKEVKFDLEKNMNTFNGLAELVPQFYEELRKLKFYGDKQMNEILLRQINIYVDQIRGRAEDYEKKKIAKFEENKKLRLQLKEKYTEHDQLKEDTVEDYKNLHLLQRKLNFYETDFIIEREESEKLK
jgi:chromosome segregation ATPase